MKLAVVASAITFSGALLGIGFGLLSLVAVALGVACGLGIAGLLGKSRFAGALVGLGMGLLLAFAVSWLGVNQSVRCEFGDPVDLLTLPHPAGYVYVIQDVEFSGFYKIGRTNSPARRLAEIRNSLPGASDVVAIIDAQDAPALEWQLHQRYAESRKRGEWFALSGAQVREICDI
ncbi:MAG: GIY-YIG nuclease family protein [Chloroflexi bacterium]|nr:GIY-YIG nuclease family protein [Chloroflexota bacterium]